MNVRIFYKFSWYVVPLCLAIGMIIIIYSHYRTGSLPTSAQQPISTASPIPAGSSTNSTIVTSSPRTFPPPAATHLNAAGFIWKTYTNKQYGFSIQYPCNTTCASQTFYYSLGNNTYTLGEMDFPTRDYQIDKNGLPTGNFMVVAIIPFTDSSVTYWNATENGPATPFPWSLDSFVTLSGCPPVCHALLVITTLGRPPVR